MSLLTVVQQACGELGLPIPNAVASSSDLQLLQMQALLNRAVEQMGRYPVKDSAWSILQKQYVFTPNFFTCNADTTQYSPNLTSITNVSGFVNGQPSTSMATLMNPNASNVPAYPWGIQSGVNIINNVQVASVNVSTNTITLQTPLGLADGTDATGKQVYTVSQLAYPLPTDYDFTISQTFWDRGYRWQIMGPLTPQEWQVLQGGIAPTGPRKRFRIEQGLFWLHPPAFETDNISFEYISNGWVNSVAGVAQQKYLTDTDTSVLDENCLTLSLIWRFRASKGLDYSEAKLMYDRELERLAARDGGTRCLVMNRQAMSPPFLSAAQIPDTGYGGPT